MVRLQGTYVKEFMDAIGGMYLRRISNRLENVMSDVTLAYFWRIGR